MPAAKFSLRAETAALSDEARAAATDRLDDLAQALGARHGEVFVIRDDSRMAFAYARDEGDARGKTTDAVADDIAVAQFLHGQTGYKELWSDAQAVANWIHALHPRLPWKTVWQIVRPALDSIFKLEAVRRAR